MKKSSVKGNLWKLYFLRAIRSFMLIIPVITLFLQENGLTLGEVFLLQAIFSLAVIILEVPSGYFSDTMGRKKVIIYGTGLGIVGYTVYAFSYGFFGFLVAEIILGLAYSFISGADSALIYETLLEAEEESSYKRYEGKYLSIGMASEGIASVLGGLLALVSLRFPLYVEAAINIPAFILAFTIVEPEMHLVENKYFRKMRHIVKYALHENKELKWLIVYSALVGASTLTMVWFIQPYWKEVGIPLALFGVLWAILMLVSSFFSWHADAIENLMGKKMSLLVLISLPVLGYFLTATMVAIWSIIFIFLFYITRGINNPITLDYINGLIDSDIRSTVLSIRNLASRLIFFGLGPVIGIINDEFSMRIALFASGVTFMILGVIVLIFMKKHKVI